MDTNMNIKKRNSSVWPYVIAGSAVGGAVGYLLGSGAGPKISHAVTHPDEMSENIEKAHKFLESKSRMVTDQVYSLLRKAKHGIEEGQRTYQETGHSYHAQVHDFQGKTVENMNRTVVAIEKDLAHPISELGAVYRGIERGLRTVFGRERALDEERIFEKETALDKEAPPDKERTLYRMTGD
jgi:hypothetical protein